MTAKTIIVERIAYRVCTVNGGKVFKTRARIGNRTKPIYATSEDDLRKKLRAISVQILNGEIEGAELEGRDHREFLAAREAVKPFGLSVDGACREYASAREILGAASVVEAARFYQTHSGNVRSGITVADVLGKFGPQLRDLSHSYREIFTYDLARLREALGPRVIAEVTTDDLESFIATTGRKSGDTIRPASIWRKKQVRGELVTVWNFARNHKYLPDLRTAADSLRAIKPISEVHPVWEPHHLRSALEFTAANEHAWLPWLAISAFANVRSGGILRLEWARMHWRDELLELPARSSKVRKRVTIKIPPALAIWLADFRNATGPLCPPAGDHERYILALRKSGIPYSKNVLRHSYITYRLAETNDEALVAREANTSVQKIRENYRETRTLSDRLVTSDLAKAWFNTLPIVATNVVRLHESR